MAIVRLLVLWTVGLTACAHRSPPAQRDHAAPSGQRHLPSAFKRVDRCRGRRLSPEAAEALDKILAGAKAFFRADHYDNNGSLLKKRFPVFPDIYSHTAPAADPYVPTEVGWTPGTACCDQPGARCEPRPDDWQPAVWRALQFQMTEPFDFQVRYSASGVDTKASFVVEAREDRGCTGGD
jgi:hypothetical protein